MGASSYLPLMRANAYVGHVEASDECDDIKRTAFRIVKEFQR